MIKLLNREQIDNTTNYKFIATRCNSCNSTENLNVIDIRRNGTTGGTVIALCKDCLKDLKKQISEEIIYFIDLNKLKDKK